MTSDDAQNPPALPPLVLASGSRYRAEMLDAAGIVATIDPPEVDERALDHLFPALGPEGFGLDLARRKARAVAGRHPGSVILAGDQVGVLDTAGGPVQLTKQPDEDRAVAQLMEMSGSTHLLVNAMVLIHVGSGRLIEAIDRQRVTMRTFDETDARSYLRRFEPYDSSGCYRLEDQELMAPLEPFVTDVQGEDPSGVRGLPIPLVRRMLAEMAVALGS